MKDLYFWGTYSWFYSQGYTGKTLNGIEYAAAAASSSSSFYPIRCLCFWLL